MTKKYQDYRYVQHNARTVEAPVSKKQDQSCIVHHSVWGQYATFEKLFKGLHLDHTFLKVSEQYIVLPLKMWRPA